MYETKNLINGKIYRGCHKTDNLNDDYLGSGLLLVKAVEKYGKSNFERTILLICDSFEHMLNVEREYVDFDFVSRDDTYNLRVGGFGGKMTDEIRKRVSTKLTGVQKSEETKRRMSISQTGLARSSEHRKSISEGLKNRPPVSAETKKKLSDLAKKRPSNSIGIIWLTDGISNKTIRQGQDIPDGWKRGRVCKRRQSV